MATQEQINERAERLILASPFMDWAEAKLRAVQQFADQELDQVLEAGRADFEEWKASGTPMDAFLNDTWKDIAADQAADLEHRTDGNTVIPEPTSGEVLASLEAAGNPFSEGALGADAMARIQAAWKADAEKDLDERQAMGIPAVRQGQ